MEENRSYEILKLIVELYIQKAEPVGSKTLIEKYRLDVSSATIRAIMSRLEDEGYLEKAHTSSGRVPTAKGYKYYTTHFRETSVDEQLKNSLQTMLTQKITSIEELIKNSCEIISKMTNLVSVVLGPSAGNEVLTSFQFVPLSEKSGTAIFVTNQGYVENKTFIIPDNFSMTEMIKCIALINERLVGTKIVDLVTKMDALRPLLVDYVIDQDVVYQVLFETFMNFAKDRLATIGTKDLLANEEFKNNTEKLGKVIEALNNESILRAKLIPTTNTIEVKVGKDDLDNEELGAVTSQISIGGYKVTVALVGPKRMDYQKVITSLEYLINEVSKKFEGGE
ncbi:MAG: heat-inducible transcriptional repressor HrcA [Erysipelotrichaceae bacterium]|jgi:heat-inducible transcriptional repressor|nr:heat-inducible transcriptional repressor HrcA [Erysipelotrichaceae bacterium]